MDNIDTPKELTAEFLVDVYMDGHKRNGYEKADYKLDWITYRQNFVDDINAYVRQEMMKIVDGINTVELPSDLETESLKSETAFKGGQINLLIRLNANIANYKGG